MWVAPLTVVIWIYAERELTVKNNVQIRIVVKNTDPRFLIQLRDAEGRVHPDLTIRAELSGPHARVDEVTQKLEAAGTAVAVDVDTKLGSGIHSVSLGMLGNDPLFMKAGLTVATPIPREVEVSIDPMVQRDVEVRLRPTVTNLEPNPTFEPRKVRVTGPESALQGATLVAYAELPPLKEPGMKDIPNVEVALSVNDPHVTLSPTVVSAKVEVKNPEVAGKIDSMPVWPLYTLDPVWDRLKPVYDTAIFGVNVIGPADAISGVKRADYPFKPKAYLDLSTATPPINGSDPTATKYTARLKIDFGDSGLRPLSPEDANKRIPFTLVERKPAE